MLFPEFEAPVRVPKLFPIPTHLWKDSGSASVTATSGQMYVVFAPRINPWSHALGYIPGAITPGVIFSS